MKKTIVFIAVIFLAVGLVSRTAVAVQPLIKPVVAIDEPQSESSEDETPSEQAIRVMKRIEQARALQMPPGHLQLIERYRARTNEDFDAVCEAYRSGERKISELAQKAKDRFRNEAARDEEVDGETGERPNKSPRGLARGWAKNRSNAG